MGPVYIHTCKIRVTLPMPYYCLRSLGIARGIKVADIGGTCEINDDKGGPNGDPEVTITVGFVDWPKMGPVEDEIDIPGVPELVDIVGFVGLLKEGPVEDDLDPDVFLFRVTPTATPIIMLISTRNARMPVTIAPFLDLQNGGGDVPLGPYVSLV
jgi:hypothetical protein